MNEEFHDESRTYRLAKNRFVIMLVSSIAVALLLVLVALALYGSSGAAQLDLSRPGYSDVRSQVNAAQDTAVFPSTGEINKQAVNNFEELYNKTASQATSVNAFDGGPLSDAALRINNDPAATANQ